MDVTGTFDAIVSELDPAMLIVTAVAGEERDGCLVGFATQSSIDPRRFLACISRANRTYAIACRSPVLAVHVVPAGADAVAELFGGETADEVDKLAQVSWRPGPEGVPILADCPTWFAGRVIDRHPAGDHDAFLLEPIAADHQPGVGAMPFHRAKHIDPGHPA